MGIGVPQVKAEFYLLGERAAVLTIPGPANLACQRRIWYLAEELRSKATLLDVVPGMNNLTLIFDPLLSDGKHWLAKLRRDWQHSAEIALVQREVEIPVRYGGEGGPDLQDVAKHAGLTPSQVTELHVQAEYIVFFLGFQPGFAYLGGLPEPLFTPRRSEPRLAVPAGSVGIGGSQTGIYPAVSPGGWQIIGRTDIQLFDPEKPQPSLLLPGDRVRFVALGEGNA
ncbi:5-oxoprolinase subunit PxpB [Neisseriaceae bacterium TC5R-5]|nr:5-oxoprolinase subunit PxpB [Neisseriaceae bacterium TC5R-5]